MNSNTPRLYSQWLNSVTYSTTNHLFDGLKMEESEGYNYFFVVFYALRKHSYSKISPQKTENFQIQ